jgi:fused signal recognition particle receptor
LRCRAPPVDAAGSRAGGRRSGVPGEKYGIPIHAIGVGETAEDLRPFEARACARGLVGLEP